MRKPFEKKLSKSKIDYDEHSLNQQLTIICNPIISVFHINQDSKAHTLNNKTELLTE